LGEDTLRAQYEAYPYPARDPADEAKRLVTGSPSHLVEIAHYLRGGRPVTGSFRALVAGGGTGDGAIMLAQQLAEAGAEAEVIHLDLSRASARIAEARARARGLANIRFVHGSLTELDTLALGHFDYIDCCGVLHHLEDPPAALSGLAGALADDGGIGLMVYGTLGRTGVYPAQRALRLLGNDADPAAKVKLARRLLGDLPDSNWLNRNDFLADHLHGDDAGLYDLLLHSRDRAYLVPEVFDLAGVAGLSVTTFIEPARYDPATYLGDAELRARAAALPWPERCALAELLAGSMKRHVAYLAKGDATKRVARPDGAMVPILREGDGEAMAQGLASSRQFTAELESLNIRYRLGRLAPAIVSRIDGKRSLDEIHADLSSTPSREAFDAAFAELYAALNGVNILLLSRPGVVESGQTDSD
jgi:SAM-dependent methyltransferase